MPRPRLLVNKCYEVVMKCYEGAATLLAITCGGPRQTSRRELATCFAWHVTKGSRSMVRFYKLPTVVIRR